MAAAQPPRAAERPRRHPRRSPGQADHQCRGRPRHSGHRRGRQGAELLCRMGTSTSSLSCTRGRQPGRLPDRRVGLLQPHRGQPETLGRRPARSRRRRGPRTRPGLRCRRRRRHHAHRRRPPQPAARTGRMDPASGFPARSAADCRAGSCSPANCSPRPPSRTPGGSGRSCPQPTSTPPPPASALQLADRSSPAQQRLKTLLHRIDGIAPEHALREELATFADNWSASSVADALRAFIAPRTTKADTK